MHERSQRYTHIVPINVDESTQYELPFILINPGGFILKYQTQIISNSIMQSTIYSIRQDTSTINKQRSAEDIQSYQG